MKTVFVIGVDLRGKVQLNFCADATKDCLKSKKKEKYTYFFSSVCVGCIIEFIDTTKISSCAPHKERLS